MKIENRKKAPIGAVTLSRTVANRGTRQLSEEQLRKIEENKAAAILRKQQAIQKLKDSSTSSNKTSTTNKEKQQFGNGFQKTPVKVDVETKNTSTYLLAAFKVIDDDRFYVDMPYHGASIEMFKTINGRKYEADTKKWSFPLSEHNNLVSKLKNFNSEIVINAIPDAVVKILLEADSSDSVQVNWSKIDKTLRDFLLPFQVDGIKFGIQKKGRCLIADDMGLGKTIQALGIAHYFKENWPLLIVCPSSMRFPWQESIQKFLPSVEVRIQVLTSGRGQTVDGDIVISSYDLMKNCSQEFMKKRFGVIIFDESHLLKNIKTQRTKMALQLSTTAKNIILLSGTPALSRPEELYPQIHLIDPFTFKTFFDFGMRYCNGRRDKFGWNFSGSSNLQELEMYLRKKIMIRRLKSDVIKQLPSKIRKVVILQPTIQKILSKQIKKLEKDYQNEKGAAKYGALLSGYTVAANVKLNAVCEYIEDKLESNNKFLVFGHHSTLMNGICEVLNKKKVDFIRIDSGVGSEFRKTLCDKFQNEESCRVAVLSIKAASCGITLTAAQLVIFAELYWNPGELIQAEDRVHRIGQQESVLIEYLIAKGTADETLWKIIESKLKILNKAGLSADSFKNSETHALPDPSQPQITSFLPSSSKSSENEVSISNEEILILESEDDLFSNINLEEIEYDYQISKKKRKTGEPIERLISYDDF